jgi:predicted HD phosphohydrolase
MEQVKFTEMKYGDEEDYAFLEPLEIEYASHTGVRVFESLNDLDDSMSGYPLTRLGHSIQSATRAWRDGADVDWVVSALLHDIGDMYAPYSHGQYAATIIEPFVREQCTWSVHTHADFQKYYYADKLGGNKNAREKHLGHAYYDDCIEFCERWDQNCFDPEYDNLPLEFFRPMVMEVFARKPYDPEIIRSGVRENLTNANEAENRS